MHLAHEPSLRRSGQFISSLSPFFFHVLFGVALIGHFVGRVPGTGEFTPFGQRVNVCTLVMCRSLWSHKRVATSQVGMQDRLHKLRNLLDTHSGLCEMSRMFASHHPDTHFRKFPTCGRSSFPFDLPFRADAHEIVGRYGLRSTDKSILFLHSFLQVPDRLCVLTQPIRLAS